jgi:hypothetical protein
VRILINRTNRWFRNREDEELRLEPNNVHSVCSHFVDSLGIHHVRAATSTSAMRPVSSLEALRGALMSSFTQRATIMDDMTIRLRLARTGRTRGRFGSKLHQSNRYSSILCMRSSCLDDYAHSLPLLVKKRLSYTGEGENRPNEQGTVSARGTIY